ncbi:Lrp/AsnC family transcriptional regulator [Paraferrimonas sp. SM1919]|uniref:Lrp/AsnC family transcriptional regulator n=1 Tax=Paraferrimonas sp. SM1919 TaxID=2662263 RepID=UPI0013D2F3C6|nr:Lrp/AsnC family transcriptional regulator [Paraferrimonas sp. SM1919]
MDSIDKKILDELQKDAKLTNQELATKVSLSPAPCLRRVRALEQQGIIQGYHASVDQEKCGLSINAFVLIKMVRPTESIMKAFEDHINRVEEVVECFLMTGAHDYMLHVVSPSLKEYEKFVRRELNMFESIASIESSFAFGQVKRLTRIPIPR